MSVGLATSCTACLVTVPVSLLAFLVAVQNRRALTHFFLPSWPLPTSRHSHSPLSSVGLDPCGSVSQGSTRRKAFLGSRSKNSIFVQSAGSLPIMVPSWHYNKAQAVQYGSKFANS